MNEPPDYWPGEFATPTLLLAAIEAYCGRSSGAAEAIAHVLWLNTRTRDYQEIADKAIAKRLVDSL